MQENLCGLVTQSTVAPTGTIGSMASGVGVGTSQASQASTKVSQETNLGERDSLLKAIGILLDAENAKEENPLGMDLFPEGLRDMLGLTRNGAASAVNKTLISPATVASHVSQLPIDVTAALQGLAHSVKDYHELLQTQQASTIDFDKELLNRQMDFFANCRALSQNFSAIFDKLHEHIDGNFKQQQGSANKSHLYMAKSTGSASAFASLGTAGLMSLMVDMIGSSMREVSGSVEFSKQETLHPDEKDIYQAFFGCSRSISVSKDSKQTFLALQELEQAILNFDRASAMRRNHSLTGPSVSVFTRIVTSELFVTTLTAVNASSLGLTEARIALEKEKDKSTQNTRESAAKASLIKDFSGGDAQHHSQNVSAFCDQFDNAMKHIDQQLQAEPNHESVAFSAKSAAGSSAALVIAASLIPGFTGLISREVSGSIDFTQNDKGSKQESTAVLRTRKDLTGDDLDNLMSRVCALQERVVRCHELGVSAPVVLGVSEAITSGSVIASLNMIAGMYLALREIRTLSESPSKATQLDEAEQIKAREYVQSAIDSNKKTGASLGTAAVSEHLSLHQQLQSIMDKVVLMHRSYINSMNFGADRHDINSAGRSTIGFSQGNSTGFFMGALGVIALASLQCGISTEALIGALSFSTQTRRASDGVDRIETHGSKTNMSFLSNSTRLLEDHFDRSSVIQTTSGATYLGAEATFSRSLTVAMCQSGALKEILRQMVQDEEEHMQHVAGHLDSALVSDALKPRLNNAILKVLDQAELNRNPIPNLNDHMASSLASASNTSIASALSAHSVFISPILKSIVAARKASQVGESQKNEAVSADSEVSRIISTALNLIQGFTINSMDEMKKFANPFPNSSIAHSSGELNDTAMVASCAISLLCEELFELCLSRSFTLLDKHRMDQTAKQTKNQTKKESGVSVDAIKEDSGLGQEYSATHVSSALRLTLSRLGVSLGELASNIEASPNLLKDHLEMHFSQKSFVNTMVSSLSELSRVMLAISAGLSNFPVSTAGSTDTLRHGIHSTDHSLVIEPSHSSERSTKDCGTESSLLTGIATDCVASIMTAATKLLLQASVLGLDTTLSVAKIMEILTIHPRPLDALILETQAMSQPNGLSNNLSKQTQNSAVLSTLGAASVVIASKTDRSQSTGNSILALQLAIDNRIDQIALLEDEEEELNNTLGLKAFYEILIRILHDGDEHANYKDITLRFHRGGIALSNYHSAHGGISNNARERNTNRLISEYGFNKCDDAASLLELFIQKAIKDERKDAPTLLNKLKRELAGHTLSAKSEKRWEYIVDKVIDQLKTNNSRSSLFHPDNFKANKKILTDRKIDLLNNWEPLKEKEVTVNPKEKEELVIPKEKEELVIQP